MSHALVIVESPAKARTISKFLGKGYIVESSIGHIRDLPTRSSDLPEQFRKKTWARIGVDVEEGFKPLYVVPDEKKAQVKKLKQALDKATTLLLATDEDREGEAIAWHLTEVLQPKVPVKRMVFHEITEKAIQEALQNSRSIDQRLVDAQEARRILDRLYGYEVSPVLWRKVRPRLSAGRVQSVATRLVVERERQRRAFVSADYWSLRATLLGSGAEAREIVAEMQELVGRRIAVGRHFDAETGKMSANATRENVLLLTGDSARALEKELVGATFTVADIDEKPFVQKPYAPFITSTLQQEAGRKLGFGAQRAMRTAQRLYERGYITYMRTDSTTLSQEALNASRNQIVDLYGKEYLSVEPREYTKKVKGAQEAHEAIRPAGEVFSTPDQLKADLDIDELRLYDLIWKRTIASQMKDATGMRTQVRFRVPISAALAKSIGVESTGDAIFSASGKVLTFPGFMRVYVEGSDDPEAELENKEKILPPLKVGETLPAQSLEAKQHSTQPPARFTEASLVKELEVRGIGRPSTYASIIQTIQDRGYVWKQSGALVPTLTAFAVIQLLEKHFQELVDYEFTSRMEEDLDEISGGEKKSEPWLEAFYYGAAGKKKHHSLRANRPTTLSDVGLKGLIGTGVELIDARGVSSLIVGKNAEGEEVAARVGRYGPYLQIGDTERRVSITDDTILDELDVKRALELLDQAKIANRLVGVDPATGKEVFLKTGSYGPYVQLGEPELTAKGTLKKDTKPKMASLWPTMKPETLTFDQAMKLLSYPKSLGKHPETGAEITAQDGKFGPYIRAESADGKAETRSLESHDKLASITLDEAVQILAQPRPPGRSPRGRAAQGPIASLGPSAVTGKQIEVRTGKFGPYVTDGQVNATIPKGRDPQKVTLEEALEFIAAREQRMRDQGQDPRAAKPKKSSSRRRKS